MDLFRRHQNSPIASPARFKELYECSRLSVFRYIYGLTGGPQDEVEDLTAETFLRAWKARYRFDGDMDSAVGWLIRIAKRLVIDGYRRTLRASRDRSATPQAESTPEQIAIIDEQKQFLFNLLASLPAEPREIIVLRYMLGWRVSDIARHMDTTENNISVIIHRTLAKLREKWMEVDPEILSTVFLQKERIS
ncbi:MAG TPA: sigma-70 family RNA polymerase sigma factor [Anaerolineales bacterium]|nr:sigma-70 family RNA polymerase sigma factor [Anaerolineales bacterium]